MGLEIVRGESRNGLTIPQLVSELQKMINEGTVYLGYPVLSTADERVYVDALLISQSHGLVAFRIADSIPGDSAEWERCVQDQDRLYSVLESHLGSHEVLRRGRRLAFTIETVTIFGSIKGFIEKKNDGHYCTIGEIAQVFEHFSGIEEEVYISIQAALQRVTTIKPAKKRIEVSKEDSRGAVLKEIEKGIANLDEWQKKAAIETPDGPQRIRGLAGSGKTIVLALKAAYLHAQHPDWHIVLSFYSRALYQQMEDLVTRFTFAHSNDAPDFTKLQILHGWGNNDRDGVYRRIASHVGAPVRDFNYARNVFGREEAFQGACKELLDYVEQGSYEPVFHSVLIDEAQDFPPEFFKLVYKFTHNPKRIVWAYDELQNISDSPMLPTNELFGNGSLLEPAVDISNIEGEPKKDITLPVCYRNSPWSLATAHALGLGIYRTQGLVQHLDDPNLWTDIGYDVVTGSLEYGKQVSLQRKRSSYPEYFPTLLNSSDAVRLKVFETQEQQDVWVAKQVERNINTDELEYDDILLVLPDAFTSKRRYARIRKQLAIRGIDSHLVGVGSSVDEVFVEDSVAIAHIFRAKGNEAPMVYALDSQHASRQTNVVTRRNTLFTAITRSRAWIRICGWGDDMMPIAEEYDRIRKSDFALSFTVPTIEELADLRRIHRDRSEQEVRDIERMNQYLSEITRALESGLIEIEDLSPETRQMFTQIVQDD